jgi:hypothetical protein
MYGIRTAYDLVEPHAAWLGPFAPVVLLALACAALVILTSLTLGAVHVGEKIVARVRVAHEKAMGRERS